MAPGNSSKHYLGEKGAEYYGGRFGDRLTFGRRYQSKYFTPYCSSETRLLDFGCGDGTMLRELPSKSQLGVEVNPTAINTIQVFNQDTEYPITLYEALSDVPSSGADVVISNHCLEHVLNPLKALQEIHRILDVNGKMILVVPFDDWRGSVNFEWKAGDPDNHLFTWSPLNLGNLVTEAGFNVLKVQLKTFAWSPKLFFVYRFLGETAFRLSCHLFSKIKNRREVLCVAKKN